MPGSSFKKCHAVDETSNSRGVMILVLIAQRVQGGTISQILNLQLLSGAYTMMFGYLNPQGCGLVSLTMFSLG